MTIKSVDSGEQNFTENMIKVSLGNKGENTSVPTLKFYFENRSEDIEFSEQKKLKNARKANSDGNVSNIHSKGVEIISPLKESKFVDSSSKVRFTDEDGQSKEEVLKQVLQIDIDALPSYEDLQSSLTPRGSNSPKRSPPPLKRRNNLNQKGTSLRRGSSAPSVNRRNPLDSPTRKAVSSSSGNLPVTTKGGGFSPRHRLSRVNSRSFSLIKTSFESSMAEKLKNDDWISELPSVKRKTKRFNKSAKKFIKNFLEKRETSKPCLELVRNELEDFVKIKFDNILYNDTNEFMKNPLKMESAGSPRSVMYMQYVLEQIQNSDILTKRLMPCIMDMKKALILYLERKKEKTGWTMTLANLLSYLIHYRSDLITFMSHIDKISDKEIADLLQSHIENRIHNFLREYIDAKSYLLLRPDLANIHLDFHDALKIHMHKHYVWEPQDVLIKFTDINMEHITQGFDSYEGVCLERFTINKKLINTQGLIGAGLDRLKCFYSDFLLNFYRESNKVITPQELQKEVEHILQNKDVASKEVLSLCVLPWKHFHEAVRLLYPGLQSGMATLPEDGHGCIHIDINRDGTYRVIRIIKYIVYQLKKREKGSSYAPDRNKPLGKIEFVWTVTPCLNEKGARTWSGCIQIPKAIKVEERTTYDEKWKILHSLIDYTDVEDQMTLSRLPIIEDHQAALEFDQEVIEAFDRSEPFLNYVQPSKFMIEFLAKNFCREALIEYQKSHKTDKNGIENIDELANKVWEDLKINGEVLEPFLTRLSVFDEKLRRHLMIKSKRTLWTDKLLSYLKELVLSSKYAEYGIPIKNDLNTFLKILEEDIKDSHMRQLILNVMCGRWENFNGRKDPVFQDEHIAKIMGTLACLRKSSKCLKPVLSQMVQDSGAVSKHGIINKKHLWIEPAGKVSPISNIDVKQIVRCFMQYTRPIFDRVTVNGIEVKSSGLEGGVKERQKEYFKRLLRAIYLQYAPRLNEKMLEDQASYMVNYESLDKDLKELAHKNIPCFELLQLCANSCWMVADIFIRNLYNLNNPPIKINMIQGTNLHIHIDKDGTFSVEHQRCYGIYPRETPDNIRSNRILKNQCLAKIPFSWRLSPYQDNGRPTYKGELQVMDVIIIPGTLAEYEYIIFKALNDYNSDFRSTPQWEDFSREPELYMPLSTTEGKELLISSPRYKRPKTPR